MAEAKRGDGHQHEIGETIGVLQHGNCPGSSGKVISVDRGYITALCDTCHTIQQPDLKNKVSPAAESRTQKKVSISGADLSPQVRAGLLKQLKETGIVLFKSQRP